MACRLSLPQMDLTCPICCEIFRDPVVLKCSHSFCASCLQQYWTHGRSRNCPMCRKQSLDDPVPSLTLRNLCDSFIEESEASGGSGELVTEMCPLHGERLKLFCLPDNEPICVVCHTSRKHKQHDCCPVSEAVVDVKEKMQSALSTLQEKKDAFDEIKKNYEDTVVYIQTQAQFVERRTREEFEKLHSFLQAEEQAQMEELRREEAQKKEEMMRKIEDITRDIESVSESIRILEEEIALEGIAVLHKCKQTLIRANRPIETSEMAQGALIDVAKYLDSLAFHTWEKMRRIIKLSPVTLDPNTASPWLILSDDLTSVRDSDLNQQVPCNPERFDPDTGVLGRRGFTSGRWAWNVSVGDNMAWVVGVAKASVQRKEKVPSVLKNGYLCVYFYQNMYFAGTSPLNRLNLKKKLQNIRVELNCDRGQVSFYDPDNNEHIYTFKHPITETVFPYFWVGCQQCPLTVQPLDFCVTAADLDNQWNEAFFSSGVN